ncbi:hypothetical protein NMG60_11005571 [Bertholletia excelsa]
MSPASKSKSKEKKAGKEAQKASSKSSGHANTSSVAQFSGYNPLLGKFHTLDTAPLSSASPLHVNGRFRNIDDSDDHSATILISGVEFDAISNNGSWSGDSEDHKEKMSNHSFRQESVPGADCDKREKIRQKNERKHQRQKERRAQELHERCNGFLMSRKLEALAQQLVAMGFPLERATLALILNEGKIEESVSWLFDGGEEADHQKEHNVDSGNLKIDISEELACVAEMEITYKCSKQEVERAVIVCEGDLEKAAETLRLQKQEAHSAPLRPEETGDPPIANNVKHSVAANQISLKAQQPKPNASVTIQQRSDEKDFNYTKTGVTTLGGLPVELGSRNMQASLNKGQPKLEWAKQQITMPTDKRWTSSTAASNSTISYSVASPLQATPPAIKTESRYVGLGTEMKSIQLGSVKEPVVMQRPQSANGKQPASTSMSSSPGTDSGWYPKNGEILKPDGGLSPSNSIPSKSGSFNPPNGLSSNQFYNQFHFQHNTQFVPSSSSGLVLDYSGSSSRANGWNRVGKSHPTLAAASSLGLFSGLGSNGSSSGLPSPVDWNTNGGSMLQLDYTKIDWTLDRSSISSKMLQQGMSMASAHIYDSYTNNNSGVGIVRTTAMRPSLANGSGVSFAGLQMQDGVASETSADGGGGSREWASPFEEKDLFSLPRQFVSSPSPM